jgi:hypothetical protein
MFRSHPKQSIDHHQHRSIPKPSHQRPIELTTIDQTQANRSIISTGYKDAPQCRSTEPQTLELLGFVRFNSKLWRENLPRHNLMRLSMNDLS